MGLLDSVREDIAVVFEKDPAARGTLEVVTCYPGLHAIWIYRVAHRLWNGGYLCLARWLSHVARFLTGIEIHPGARIGRRFFIDHGMGVVIGETAEIGDGALLYQDVVLGGTSLKKGKRHPTLGRDVVVGSGSTVLGPITIGDGARVGAGSVVLHDVEPGTVVVGVPARATRQRTDPAHALDHADLPDPVAQAIKFVLDEHEALRARLERVEGLEGVVGEMDRRMTERHEELSRLFAAGETVDFCDGGGI